MTENIERIGNFTSSEIHKLLSEGTRKGTFGKPALTYIEEKKTEKRMGRSLEVEFYSHATQWGLLLEKRIESLIDEFGYMLESQKTRVHPKYNFWAGSRDMFKEKVKVGEIKAYQPKNFAAIVDCMMQKDVILLKKLFPKEYWQTVSNAAISEVQIGELIAYMPYLSELEDIREMAANYDDYDQWKYRFISEGENCTLPYLPDGSYYKNLNRFEFKVPKSDFDLLEQKVIKAEELKNKEPSVIIAEFLPDLNATIKQ